MAMQENGDNIIQVKIFSEDNANLWWCVGCTETERIGTVKKRLISGSGRFVARLFHLGVQLDDKRTLRQSGINENTILSTGRGASIVRGKEGSRGSHPDWSPNWNHQDQKQQQKGGHTPALTRPPSASGGAPAATSAGSSSLAAAPPAAAGNLGVRASPKRSAVSPPSRSSSGHAPSRPSSAARGRPNTGGASRPASSAGGTRDVPPASSPAAAKGSAVDLLRYTLSMEEEKLVLEHKVKQLEAQLAAARDGTAAAAATTAAGTAAATASSSSSAPTGGGVTQWPFRPFRMGLRTPPLPLDVTLFAKDPTTSAIAGAFFPPQAGAARDLVPPPAAAVGAPPLMVAGAVASSTLPYLPAQPHGSYSTAALLISTQPATVAYGTTIYPDQGSLIAKPGFLGSPAQLFNSSAAHNAAAPPIAGVSMASV